MDEAISKAPVLIYERVGHIAVIRLNRPHVHNALDAEMMCRLATVWERVRDDPEVRVAIITGEGDRTFCAGADVRKLLPLVTGAAEPKDAWERCYVSDPEVAHRAMLRFLDPGKPVIAAVNGDAIAGGMELLQAVDIRVARAGARFRLSEVQIGLFPAGGSSARLPRLIAPAIANEMLFTGEPISSEEALRLGYVNHVVPQNEVLPKAFEIARRIAANAPLAVQAVRQSVRASRNLSEVEALKHETRLSDPIFATEDAREGHRAFVEKRSPVFVGR